MNSSFALRANAASRRAIDVVAAVIGLILVAPVMVLIAIAVRAETPGPVLFSQPRLGRNGKQFQIYKFRKFHHDADPSGCGVTLRDDPRMTAVGRILERTKLDELPQLWNILLGDMSVVGPRPETLQFAECFTGRYRDVLDHRPGLFGPSQTLFRNEGLLYPTDYDPHEFYRTVLFPAKGDIDLAYYARRSVTSDLLWMGRGLRVTIGKAPNETVLESGRESEGGRWSIRLLGRISRAPEPIIRKPLT